MNQEKISIKNEDKLIIQYPLTWKIAYQGEEDEENKTKIYKSFTRKVIIILVSGLLIIIYILFHNLKKINNTNQNNNKINYKNNQILDNVNKTIIDENTQFNQLKNSIKNFRKNLKKKNPKALHILELLTPLDVYNKPKIRIGSKNKDGGYILADDFFSIKNKIAYSFGISYEYTWDIHMAKLGFDVFMYDPYINGIKKENPKMHWFKKGVCGKNNRKENLYTIKEILEQNGHLNNENMILKMDVEGAEWESFEDMEDDIITKFEQITMEVHFTELDVFIKVLTKISKTHQLFHIHCNNAGKVNLYSGIPICKYIELSYIIKKGNKFLNSLNIYPDPNLDIPNVANKDEIFIGFPGLINID